MRQQPARLICLSLSLFGGLLIVAGCQSVGPLSGSVNSPGPFQVPAPPSEVAEATMWKRAAPPTPEMQQQWTNAAKTDPAIVRTGFQAAPMITVEPMPLQGPFPSQAPPTMQPGFSQQTGFRTWPGHGAMPLALPGAPTESNPAPLEYRIRPPDVLLIDSLKGLVTAPVNGPYTVRPDGTVGIGIYGPAAVSGLTIEQARPVIARVIYSKMAQAPYQEKDEKGNPRVDDKGKPIMITPPTYEDVLKNLNVNILAYNSSFYYVIVDAAGLGEQVYRFPVTGSETVLDGISLIGGLQPFSSPKRIWVARKNVGPGGTVGPGPALGPGPAPDTVLPVNWKAITQAGEMNTNWQVMPGDRIYVKADPVRRFTNNLQKFMEPVKEVLGVTLLGSQTVNSIATGTVGGAVR